MFRSSPRRSQKLRCFKPKHALQICLLVGVCVWLLYQVRHSNEKKQAYGEAVKAGNELVKLGRKDIHPHSDEVVVKEESRDTGEEDENGGETESGTGEAAVREDGDEERHDQLHDRNEGGEEQVDDAMSDGKGEAENDTGKVAETEDTTVGVRETDKDSTVGVRETEKERIDTRMKVEEDKETMVRKEDKREEVDELTGTDEAGKKENIEKESREAKEPEEVEEIVDDYTQENRGEKDGETKDDTAGLDGEDAKNNGVGHSQEAREEQYKADDASSGVAHDSKNLTAAHESYMSAENATEGDGKMGSLTKPVKDAVKKSDNTSDPNVNAHHKLDSVVKAADNRTSMAAGDAKLSTLPASKENNNDTRTVFHGAAKKPDLNGVNNGTDSKHGHSNETKNGDGLVRENTGADALVGDAVQNGTSNTRYDSFSSKDPGLLKDNDSSTKSTAGHFESFDDGEGSKEKEQGDLDLLKEKKEIEAKNTEEEVESTENDSKSTEISQNHGEEENKGSFQGEDEASTTESKKSTVLQEEKEARTDLVTLPETVSEDTVTAVTE